MASLNFEAPMTVNEVKKSFKSHKVLNGISFQMKKGEIYSLVGLNGIGKTTIIKIILGLLNADGGKVLIFDKDNDNKLAKENITYLPEKFSPSAFLKGHEFLSLSCSYYGKKYDVHEAREICRKLNFDPMALNRRVSGYSKGMGQKLGLVSVFLSRSPLLILDEPMSGLDPSARIFLKHMLKQYRDEGNSIFFTSHILADIEEICDRIGILHDGDIYYEGTVDKFIKTYKTENLEQAFLRAIDETAAITEKKKSVAIKLKKPKLASKQKATKAEK